MGSQDHVWRLWLGQGYSAMVSTQVLRKREWEHLVRWESRRGAAGRGGPRQVGWERRVGLGAQLLYLNQTTKV